MNNSKVVVININFLLLAVDDDGKNGRVLSAVFPMKFNKQLFFASFNTNPH
ncbi:hypothetical protein [Paraglaciecola chathamensis]|jgi:hypothetical protein|uniref:Uncharacterized protein n=1 Tax=Paraglaciecola chathamensis S18K6 TaxID=1127672 RepID=A0AAV3UV21_9ALTE|nr:hypothetical protein [Paraglaciecola chathamensis]MDO6840160.1 hypothetical protein [Paraglaciecola chathamensis]GAC08844.1 hypothetical protein GCHA_0881 [Paraglaciecola chathamensis S18K6]